MIKVDLRSCKRGLAAAHRGHVATTATLAKRPRCVLKVERLVQVVRMLIVVLVAFIVCWTPQEVIVFMDANWPADMEDVSTEQITRLKH